MNSHRRSFVSFIRLLSFPLATLAVCALAAAGFADRASAAPIHTTYLWHMHQPIYWPERSTWNGATYEFVYETITLGHSQNDEFSIFNSDDRVRDYQDYPKSAIASILDLPDAGAQVSFAGSLIQNVSSLAAAGWNGGRYASSWSQPYRDAIGWTTSGGRARLDPVVVAFHHPIGPLVDDMVLRRMIQAQKAIAPSAWGSGALSKGFFPAEMCFSERMIPVLVAEGIEWSVAADIHIARACADYPYDANQDNADPPNRADQQNPAQGFYSTQSISRGVTTKVPVPYALRPQRAEYVDPESGAISSITVVPAASAMSWNEGYGLFGTGEIDAIAARNDPAKPMLALFAHDGDNAWSGGYSYYNENVTQFAHAAASQGYEPTTIAEFLADHPVDAADVVHVEDGGWVNADGDFGSPQFINWNWPLHDASGQFDIPNGWALDERNWAVLTAATNRVLTAEQIGGAPSAVRIVDPTLPGATDVEKAWHFLLAGHESGYMYYGSALDLEIKPTLAANRAVEYADLVIAGGIDATPPTIWLPQRLPWNPGGRGGGSLWGYPGGQGAPMPRDFHVWTFVHDVSGVDSVRLLYRVDLDGTNPIASHDNETYAGGGEVGSWVALPMTRRAFPAGNVHGDPEIDFTVTPAYIADHYWVEIAEFSDALIDYYVEATDALGNVRKSAIQHVYVGDGEASASPAVEWTPAEPKAGETLTISYDPVAGALPDASDPVRIHIGHSGWTNVLSPDPVMTFDSARARWDYTYTIPSTATSVDFVFTDGLGNWDNHGGADWHVPVSGGASPSHMIDGVLDAGMTPVASCDGLDLYADYDGQFLYVAAQSVAATAGLDHFILIGEGAPPASRTAPWGKSGTAPEWQLLLGNEEQSGWSGWFDASETLVSAGLQQASGTVLEGLVDVNAVWGSAPSLLHVAFAAYGSADGGPLTHQVPCGNADGNLDVAEQVEVVAGAVAVGPLPVRAPAPTIELLSANPFRSGLRARIDVGISEHVTVELLDVRGRRVARLFEGRAAGVVQVATDERLRLPGAGVYFLRALTGGRSAIVRVVHIQ